MRVTGSYIWHCWAISASRSHPSGCRTFSSSMSVVREGKKAGEGVEDTCHLGQTMRDVIQYYMLFALSCAAPRRAATVAGCGTGGARMEEAREREAEGSHRMNWRGRHDVDMCLAAVPRIRGKAAGRVFHDEDRAARHPSSLRYATPPSDSN